MTSADLESLTSKPSSYKTQSKLAHFYDTDGNEAGDRDPIT